MEFLGVDVIDGSYDKINRGFVMAELVADIR